MNEFLFRRADSEDMVSAHLLALDKAEQIGFGRYIISAKTPFVPEDLSDLRHRTPNVVKRYFPEFPAIF